ncbi:uncharacterized protein [Temnothorax longispinosus]
MTSERLRGRDPGTMDISSMLEVQVKVEADIKENVTPGKEKAPSTTGTTTTSVSQEESNYYKLMFGNDIAAVRFRRIHCTACDVHIGSAPAQAHNMFEHPVLRTLLCASCREFYGDGSFEQGDDATDMFCRWCANGGNLYCCSYCSNTFCYKCIRRNFSPLVRKKIEADEKWKCFVCNPSDLYSGRAVCWALLQHVQTVTRILAHDKKMTAQEVEEKMNFDETTCCPRRNKRKRRRLESNSEEEDETYSPKVNGAPAAYIKRKPLKRQRLSSQSTTNGIVTKEVQFYRPPIPIRPRPASFLSGRSLDTESNSTISHENSVTNEWTELKAKRIVLSSPSIIKSNTSLPSRFDPNALQRQPPLYHASFMNTKGSAAYIHTPVKATVNPTRIILPPRPQQQSTSYQSQQASSYQSFQPLQSSPNTMVSIPNPVDKHGRPVLLLSKPEELNITPNIIELDSDSDDEKVTRQENLTTAESTRMNVNTFSKKVVPVALTWENSDDDVVREEQPLREVRATVEKELFFNEIMLPHSRELDKVLTRAKGKMYNLFDVNKESENVEAEAEQRIRHFSCKMRDTLFQLVNINDRIIRQYADWRRSRKTETSSINESTLVSQENVDIPLDMVCVNDSDPEPESENQDYLIREPTDAVKNSNVIKDLLTVTKKSVVHRGVGDDSAHSADKAIQVYGTVYDILKDYEKVIGYSVCTRPDQNPKDDSVSNLPAESDKNFGKYEEKYIFFLQNIEDNGIETEDMEEAGLDEMSLQEAVETSPFISHLLQDTELPVVSTDQSENCQEENEPNSSDSIINSVTKDDESDTLDEKTDNEIVNNSTTNTEGTDMQLDDKLQQTEQQTQETPLDTTDGEAIMSDNKEANSNKNDNVINMEAVAPTGNEEDCTIIN